MKLSDLSELMAGLEAVLRTESTALKDGNLSEMQTLAAAKTRLIIDLELALEQLNQAVEREQISFALTKLQKLAKRNERLLKATINGVQSAQDRLDKIIRSQDLLGVYDREGRSLMAENIGSVRTKTF